MTQKIPGATTNPEDVPQEGADVPQEGHGGSNARGVQNKQSKDGNGAQKRQQQKKN